MSAKLQKRFKYTKNVLRNSQLFHIELPRFSIIGYSNYIDLRPNNHDLFPFSAV